MEHLTKNGGKKRVNATKIRLDVWTTKAIHVINNTH